MPSSLEAVGEVKDIKKIPWEHEGSPSLPHSLSSSSRAQPVALTVTPGQ